jgi:hypothetical protein
MSIDSIVAEVRTWFGSIGGRDVHISESTTPRTDPQDDYVVAREIVVEPIALDKGRVALWITDQMSLGVGIELWSRVCERVSVKSSTDHFVAGWEPHQMELDSALHLLEEVAFGRFEVELTIFAGRLISTDVILPGVTEAKSVIHGINPSGFPSWAARALPFATIRRLQYRSWQA